MRTVKKFGTSVPLYYAQDGQMLAIKPKKTATAVAIRIGHVEVDLIFSLGYTPKTYYSGRRPCWAVGIKSHESEVKILSKEFYEDSNDNAECAALNWGAHLLTPAHSAGCMGYKFVRLVRETNELGETERFAPLQEKINVSSVKRADVKDYLTIVQSIAIDDSDGIKFSGWRRPENLLEQGWEVNYVLEVAGTPSFIPFAYEASVEGEDTAQAKAKKAVLNHLLAIYGWEGLSTDDEEIRHQYERKKVVFPKWDTIKKWGGDPSPQKYLLDFFQQTMKPVITHWVWQDEEVAGKATVLNNISFLENQDGEFAELYTEELCLEVVVSNNL